MNFLFKLFFKINFSEVLGLEHSGGTRAVGHNIGLKESRIYEKKNKTQKKQKEQQMKERLEADFVLNESFIDKIVDKTVPKVVAALTQHKEDTNSVGSKSSTRVLDELQNLTVCTFLLPKLYLITTMSSKCKYKRWFLLI